MTGFEGIGIWSVTGTLVTILTGLVTPPHIETYLSLNVDPWDRNETLNFKEPMGMFGIQTDINEHVRLFVEHQSSPRQANDHPGLNHAGVKLLYPIFTETTLYSGLSINSPFDSDKADIDAPLVSLGIEDGDDDFKVFMEYLADTSKLDEGRFAMGLKFIFNDKTF